MKKFLVAIVVVAFSVAAWAGDKEVTKIKEEVKGDVTKTVVKEKTPEMKEKVKIEQEGTTVKATDVIKPKTGDVVKETVKFEKYEAASDYIYVIKDNKMVKVKHKLSDTAKKGVLELKKGDTVTITSTHPLTQADLAVITDLQKK